MVIKGIRWEAHGSGSDSKYAEQAPPRFSHCRTVRHNKTHDAQAQASGLASSVTSKADSEVKRLRCMCCSFMLKQHALLAEDSNSNSMLWSYYQQYCSFLLFAGL